MLYWTRRLYSSRAATQDCPVLSRWIKGWSPTATVGANFSDVQLSAFAWLEQETNFPHSLLQRLFRQRVVRMYRDGKVAPVSPSTNMPLGALLLIPNSIVDLAAQRAQHASHRAEKRRAAVEIFDRIMTANVLYEDEHMLVLNKPSGLAVQGGPHVRISLDAVLAAGAEEYKLPPYKLVHRLDKATSGAIAVARSREAAAFLTAALNPTSRAADTTTTNPTLAHAAALVRKEYWALVAPRRPLLLKQEGRGSVRSIVPVRSDAGGEGVIEAAVSDWELVGVADCVPPEGCTEKVSSCEMRGEGDDLPTSVAWLRMWPQTGRKHQLRIHCATHLEAPIIGDTRYGSPPNNLPAHMHATLEAEGLIAPGQAPPLYLHARSLRLPHPDPGKAVVEVEAQAPEHWRVVQSVVSLG